ncbi:C-type lectin domain family 17, member A-like [Mytilus edulis]|uniref:C-type lectin domain family 17, member A-like n=1 Tax=Mytilus edulis TaxID=6550 RepID=UPI0039EE43CD
MVLYVAFLFICISLTSATCPKGWAEFDGECLYFSKTPKTWVDAETSCRHMHSYLATDDNPKKHEFIKEILNILTVWGAPHFWLGGTDYVIEGQWRWVETGVSMTGFSIWGVGYPQGGLGQSCLSTYFNGTELFWQDLSCGHNVGHRHHGYNYICEKSAEPSASIIG